MIHRVGNPDFQKSLQAQQAWIHLIREHHNDKLFEQKRGSLLISTPLDEQGRDKLFQYYDEQARFHLPDVKWVESVQSAYNSFVRPSISGMYYPHDIMCTPTKIIRYFMDLFANNNNVSIEHRTVVDLHSEQKLYDVVICCAGPWVKSLKDDVPVKPIRGILLKTECNFGNAKPFIPMMEYGYGEPGVHFTLSFRDNMCLFGASREDVGFSTENLEELQCDVLNHAQKFLLPESGVIGPILERTVGYRPALIAQADDGDNSVPYRIEKQGNLVLLYGFEGQGVLYAALAAREATDIIFNL